MRGSAAPELIERWKRLVEREPDVDKRARYRAFALVFAELIAELVNWQSALEGWDVRESQYLKSFEDRGEQRGKVLGWRDALLGASSLKFGSPVPEPIRLAIEGTNDIGMIERWFKVLFEADSWAEFQTRMKQP
jgi:hypothetical protein